MKPTLLLLLLAVVACSPPSTPSETGTSVQDSSNTVPEAAADTFSIEDQYADLFVTIADTGRDFEILTKTMRYLTESTGAVEMESPINPYDPERDSLMVPVDSDDEIWAGAYMLRRTVDPTMTVEYLDAYDTAAAPGTMAVVTGIWATRAEADSVVNAHATQAPVHLVIPARLYQGCMH